MLDHFAKYLDMLQQKDFEAFKAIQQMLKKVELSKDENLIGLHDINKNIYFLEKGITRHYRLTDKGNEINIYFSFEGDVILVTECTVLEMPSNEIIVALEDCELLYISRPDLIKLTQTYHAIETLFREMLELQMIAMERRQFRLQTYSAKQQYAHLMEQQPHYLQKIPQNHLASFLGITKETLSRIKKKYQNERG